MLFAIYFSIFFLFALMVKNALESRPFPIVMQGAVVHGPGASEKVFFPAEQLALLELEAAKGKLQSQIISDPTVNVQVWL